MGEGHLVPGLAFVAVCFGLRGAHREAAGGDAHHRVAARTSPLRAGGNPLDSRHRGGAGRAGERCPGKGHRQYNDKRSQGSRKTLQSSKTSRFEGQFIGGSPWPHSHTDNQLDAGWSAFIEGGIEVGHAHSQLGSLW